MVTNIGNKSLNIVFIIYFHALVLNGGNTIFTPQFSIIYLQTLEILWQNFSDIEKFMRQMIIIDKWWKSNCQYKSHICSIS